MALAAAANWDQIMHAVTVNILWISELSKQLLCANMSCECWPLTKCVWLVSTPDQRIERLSWPGKRLPFGVKSLEITGEDWWLLEVSSWISSNLLTLLSVRMVGEIQTLLNESTNLSWFCCVACTVLSEYYYSNIVFPNHSWWNLHVSWAVLDSVDSPGYFVAFLGALKSHF